MEISNELISKALVALIAAVAGGSAGFKSADVREAGHAGEVQALQIEVTNLKWQITRLNDKMQILTTGIVTFDDIAPAAGMAISSDALSDALVLEIEPEVVEE